MILLSEIFDVLQGAEFNQHATVTGFGGEAVIDPKEYNRLINLVNAGIVDLHKRFDLKKNSLQLQTTEGNVKYMLSSANALSKNPDGFILDSIEDPFNDDLIEITSITTPKGRELILNNRSERVLHNEVTTVDIEELCESLYTLDYRTLRVPMYLRDSVLTIHYKSTGKKLLPIVDANGVVITEPTDVVIEMPVPYLNALTFYVAYRLYNAKGAETLGRVMFHEGNNYQTMYQNEIITLSQAGLENDTMISDVDTFHSRGFV